MLFRSLNFIFKINSDVTSCTLIDINNSNSNHHLNMSIKINDDKKAVLDISYNGTSGQNIFNINNLTFIYIIKVIMVIKLIL